MDTNEMQGELVDGAKLLEICFRSLPKKRRPSAKWLQRRTKAGKIPSIKLGRYRFYSPQQVMEKLLALQKGGLQ